MIKGIHHVAFKCETQEQYDEMIYFYHELLELPILRKWNTGIHLDCFNEQKRTPSNDEKKIEKQAFHISEKERDAIMMERMVNDYKKAQYMEKRIGQVFEGTIVGVMSFGFFVEMDNTVEGLVPVHTLSNDFYDYDEDTMTLKGQTHGKVFQMGMRVRVVCTDVQREKGQVTFSLLERKNYD